jgi:hypothetical protein
MSSTIAGLRGRGRLWALSHCLTNFFALPTCFVVSAFHSPESW